LPKSTEIELIALMALKLLAENLRREANDRGESFDLQQALIEMIASPSPVATTLR
jgi:hypothetical protein